MNAEPKWPTPEEIAHWFYPGREEQEVEHLNGYAAAKEAIARCRAAWLTSVDDPSKSQVGEVRQGPMEGQTAIRCGGDNQNYYWLLVTPHNSANFYSPELVKGWPVVGSVPGTPAAYCGVGKTPAAEVSE